MSELHRRIIELENQRASWLKANPGRFISPNDPRDNARWALAFPDEADELSDLYEEMKKKE